MATVNSVAWVSFVLQIISSVSPCIELTTSTCEPCAICAGYADISTIADRSFQLAESVSRIARSGVHLSAASTAPSPPYCTIRAALHCRYS